MTRAQAKKLDEVHAWMDFLINKITVNGDDGSAPITGVQPILEHEHNTNKVQSKQICELVTLTAAQRAKKKFWHSIAELKLASPTLKFFLTPNKVKVAIWLLGIVLISEALGVHSVSHAVITVLKLMGWMK